MQSDALTNFVQPQGAATAVGAAGVVVPIGNVIDMLGVGSGNAPPGIIGRTTLWGHDPGIGMVKPVLQISIGTTFTTSNAATGAFALQYAADTGAGGGYVPDTWYTSSQTQAHAVGVLTAGTLLSMDVTPAPPEVKTPRFVRLALIVPAATNMDAGSINFAGLTMGPEQNATVNMPNNYSV
ncbi:MAG: hypothetical protein ACM3II_00080 [Rhodospirillaceae bacterium]